MRFGRGCEQGITLGLCLLAPDLFLMVQSLLAIAYVIFQVKCHFPAFGMVRHVDDITHPGIVRKPDKVVRSLRFERLSIWRMYLQHKLNFDMMYVFPITGHVL